MSVTTHIELGSSPFVNITECSGDLDLRGTDRANVRVETEDPLEYTQEGSGVILHPVADSMSLRLPHNGRVQIGAVSETVLAKYVEGEIDIEGPIGSDVIIRHSRTARISGHVNGGIALKYLSGPVYAHHVASDFVAKYVQDVAVDQVDGSAHIAYANGHISFGDIAGDFTLRNISGRVEVNSIDGNVKLRNVSHGVTINEIAGDITLQTDFKAGESYQLHAGGSIVIRLSGATGTRFIMPADTDLRTDFDAQPETDGEVQVLTVGHGEAEVHLSAAGGVVLSRSSGYRVDDDVNSPLDRELSEELSNISLQMDEQMAAMENMLGELSGRVKRKLERRLAYARRRVEEAQRRVEEVVDQGLFSTGAATVRVSPEVKREPVSEEERMLILRMLEDGKITVEEAEQLLTSLE